MSDLISRQAVIDFIERRIVKVTDEYVLSELRGLCENIYEMQTAYDVDKVVELLENSAHWTQNTYDPDGYSNDDSEEAVFLSEAIEIVKAGGLNE